MTRLALVGSVAVVTAGLLQGTEALSFGNIGSLFVPKPNDSGIKCVNFGPGLAGLEGQLINGFVAPLVENALPDTLDVENFKVSELCIENSPVLGSKWQVK